MKDKKNTVNLEKFYPLWDKYYALIQWFGFRVRKYPKAYKYSLGVETNTALLNTYKLSVKYGHSPSKYQYQQWRAEHYSLLIFVRLAKDLEALSNSQYAFFCKSIAEIEDYIQTI
jgi:hypothetical protein